MQRLNKERAWSIRAKRCLHQRCREAPREADLFELALRSAGIAACNLVRVSSIFPQVPHLSRAQGSKRSEPTGYFCGDVRAATREPHRRFAATVGVAIPRDRNTYGYFVGASQLRESEDIAGDYAEELARRDARGRRSSGVDPDKSWMRRKRSIGCSNEIVRTQNVTQTGWLTRKPVTTVVAAAVLVG